MKFSIKLIALVDLIFILLLSLSGSFSGILGEVAYILSFVISFLIGAAFLPKLKREREEAKGLCEEERLYLSIDKNSILRSLPLIAPMVAVIFLLSYLTTLLLGAFGHSNTLPEMGALPLMILEHALLPTLLEELLFRYLPMRLLMPYSKRACILVSSVCFALIHLNLFQIPYAFFAGLMLICIDIMAGSILPSLILHFVNNLVSVIFMKYCADPVSVGVFLGVLGVLTVFSLIVIFLNRKAYLAGLKKCLEKGERAEYSPLVLFIIVTVILSISALSL